MAEVTQETAAISPAEKRRLLERLLRQKAGKTRTAPGRKRNPTRTVGPLSFPQGRLWFLAQMEPQDPYYNLGVGVRLFGKEPHWQALEKAFEEVVKRHGALRIAFENRRGEAVQRIQPEAPRRLVRIDLRGLPTARREEAARKQALAVSTTPFDLQVGHLVRMLLFQVSKTETLLVTVVHHIVFDGWSFDVFERELNAFYHAFTSSRPHGLPPLESQIVDFALFQKEQLESGTLAGMLRYWQKQLAGVEPLELPTDRPRHGASHRGATHFMTLSAQLTEAAEGLARRHDATLFMVLFATFQLLLSRLTGRSDVASGTPITNRDREDFEKLIGFFANTLVLRTQVEGASGFLELLDAVRRMALEAYQHAQMPFEHLVQVLSPDRKEGVNPLIQLGFALQPKMPLSEISLPGLTAETWKYEAGLAKMDLEFHLVGTPEGLDGYLFYFSDLFDATTMDRFSRHFRVLLAGILEEPERPVDSLPLLAAAEEQQLLREWNDTATEAETLRLTHEQVLAHAEHRPDRILVEDRGAALSWGEMARRASTLAAQLRAFGVGPEDLVALLMERSVEWIWGLLGVLEAGGAYLPLDPAHPDARLLTLLEDAGPKVVLARHRVPEILESSSLPVLTLGPSGVEGKEFGPSTDGARRPHLENLAYVIYTSGSTGKPKGVELNHRGLLNLVATYGSDYRPEDRRTQIASPGFDGTVFEIWPGLAAGATLCLVPPEPRQDPTLLGDWLARMRIAVGSLPTPMAEAAFRVPWPERMALRILHVAGDRLHRNALREIGAEIYNLYGPTEATCNTTGGKVLAGTSDPHIGRPMNNHRSLVVDRTLRPVPIGVAGELTLGATAGLARGYRDDPRRTAERFIPDPSSPVPGSRLYSTGDLVRWDAEGQLEFLGRIDHQIKIRGNRIEIGEITAAIAQMPGFTEWAVVDRLRDQGDKELVAYLVPETGVVPKPAEFHDFLAARLPSYMVPAAFVVLESLPRNPNGKLDRRALPAPERADRSASHVQVAPRTAAERKMAEVWARVLGIDEVGVLDTFFELGGHSLLAARLVAEVGESFGVELELPDLFRAPTVARLTALASGQLDPVGDRETLPALVPAPADRYEPFPLTAIQQAYLIGRGERFDLGNVSAHGYLEFEGVGWDVQRIERVVRRMVAHHDMLRAVFPTHDRQRILESVPEYEVQVQDLRGLGPQDVERGIEAWRDEMSHQVLPADRWPLFDVRVSLLDDERIRLHLDGDGLISDAWGLGLLGRQAIELYLDLDIELPDLEVSFRDCVLAEHRLLESAVADRAREYWQQRIPELPPAPELPLAKSPESLGNPLFEGRALRLDPDTWSRLRDRAAEAGLTPSGTLLAAFAEVLAVWSKKRRMTLNLTTFNRRPWHPQVGELLGDFTTLTLLASEGGGESFVDRARSLQERLWSDLSHNQIDGLEVMRDLARRGHVSQAGLMPVVFSSILGQDPTGKDAFSTGWQSEILYRITQTPQIWLDHQVTEENGGLNCNWDSVQGLFPEGLLDDLFTAYHQLLLALTAGGEAWVSRRPIGPPAEQLAERAAANDTAAPVSADLLQDGFSRRAEEAPEAPAILTPERSLSYGELDRRSWNLAHRLAELRVAPETLVAVVMEKGWEQVVAVLAILRAGAAYLPVDPALPQERIAHLLASGKVEVLLTQPTVEARLQWPDGVARLTVSESDSTEPCDPLPTVGTPESLAYVIFTSGSTGLPKGVMIDHRGAVNTLRDINSRFRVGADDRVLALSSLSFDLSVYDIFGVLGAGGALVLPAADKSRDPAHWRDLAETHRVTLWNTVPALMELFVDAATDAGWRLPGRLRLVMMSGDWIPLPLPDRIRALAEPTIELYSLGGATEASIWSILHPIGEVDPSWKSIPYGRPMVNQTFHVLDEDLEPRPIWVPGELYIGGVGVALGYWRDEERTAERFLVHPTTGERLYRTGDLGRYVPGGDIEFLGREDFQVKIRGYRIELGEIEAALMTHPMVQNAVVDAVGERSAKRLTGWFVSSGPAPSEEALRAFLGGKLPEYMVPTAFVELVTLPLTANGKVNRKALPAPAVASSEASETGSVEERTSASQLTQRIAELAASVLEIETVDPEADLFALGASSVHMIRIANLLEHEMGLRLRVEDFYHAPNAAALAALHGAPQEAEATKSSVDARWSAGSPLEPAAAEAFKKRWREEQRDDRGPRVALPQVPRSELVAAFAEARRSHRHFDPEPLAAEQLARLLGCLARGSLSGHDKYLYPSAGGIYPVEVYVQVRRQRFRGLDAGIYAYDAAAHELVHLSSEDLDARMHDPFVNRPIYEQAAFSLFLVAQAEAIVPVYGEAARDFCVLEAGYMGQLLMMQAPECGLGLCPVGGLEWGAAREHFQLGPGHELVHSLLGGKPAVNAVWRPPGHDHASARVAAPTTAEPALVPVPRDASLPLSFSQHRMWVAHRLEPDNPAYNTAVLLHIRGKFDLEVFERALGEVLRRHEVLRTRYPDVAGQPHQEILSAEGFEIPQVDLRSQGPQALEEARRRAATIALEPFDLAVGPLLRTQALRLGEQEHAVLLGLHHIVGDAWSTGILARELQTLYEAFHRGERSPLPELTVQYADFAVWQKQWAESGAMDRELDYWQQRLGGAAQLELPTDHPRSHLANHHGARRVFEVPAELAQRYEVLGKEGGATRFMQYLGAFAALLSWATGQDDIVVGSPATHRDRLATESLIGFFVNTLALRIDLTGNPAFEEVIRRARETVRGAWEHRRVPFEKVLERLDLERTARDAPLFRVWFVLHEEPPPAFALGDLEVESLDVGTGAARYDLKLEMWGQRGGGFRCEVEYRTELFEAKSLERLEQSFLTLLGRAATGLALDDLRQVLGAAEAERRAERGAGFRDTRREGLRNLRRPRRRRGSREES